MKPRNRPPVVNALTLAAGAFIALLSACGGAAPAAEPTPNPLTSIPGIVDPANLGWPRTVEVANGAITIDAPPQSILSLSLGHDEILIGLAGTSRLAGVAAPTADPTYSNVASLVEGVPTVTGDAEAVIGLAPDIVFVSAFTRQDLVDLIEVAGITVARTDLEQSTDGQERTIRLLAYMIGAEEQAERLIADIRSRIERVSERTAAVPVDQRPGVLAISRYSDSLWVAGQGSTEGGILEAAGVVNVAAAQGVEGNQIVSAESIIAMAPDVMIITQPEPGASEFRRYLLSAPPLREVPAVLNGRVMSGEPRYYTTLSHWNVRGIEETARRIYPDLFDGVVFTDFESAGE